MDPAQATKTQVRISTGDSGEAQPRSGVVGSGAATIPLIGEIFDGKYRIDGVLGTGGMAVVLGATHLHLEQRVAIKLLLPQWAEDPDFVDRFMREGKAATKIRSEHVVRVFDVGIVSGRPYISMEYLEGSDLDRVVIEGGPLPVPTAIDFVLQACEAIAEAHSCGIVHRDLKPANLFLITRADGTPCVKVLDFGISKLASRSSMLELKTTQPSLVMGSPHYMSPEQMRSAHEADERSDIWALGAIVHELIAGRPPFRAETITALCAQILREPAPPLSSLRAGVPAAVEAVVLRCLQKEPSLRFGTVAELARALADYGSDDSRVSALRIVRILEGRSEMKSFHSLGGVHQVEWAPIPEARMPSAASFLEERQQERPRTRRRGYVFASLAFLLVGTGLGVLVMQHQEDVRSAQASVLTAAPPPPAPVPPPVTAAPEVTAAVAAAPKPLASAPPVPAPEATAPPAADDNTATAGNDTASDDSAAAERRTPGPHGATRPAARPGVRRPPPTAARPAAAPVFPTPPVSYVPSVGPAVAAPPAEVKPAPPAPPSADELFEDRK